MLLKHSPSDLEIKAPLLLLTLHKRGAVGLLWVLLVKPHGHSQGLSMKGERVVGLCEGVFFPHHI